MTGTATPSAHDDDSWIRQWDDMIALVGTDLSDGSIRWGADAIELGLIRRYLEPIELDCPLHYDEQVAQSFGYDGVIAPATSLITFGIPPMWSPGDTTIWDSSERNAQPSRTPILGDTSGPGPRTTGFFATEMEIDFLRPVVVGERVGTRGRKLLSCVPKQTRVGRGAFATTESEIVSDSGDVVARLRTSTYAYDPYPNDAEGLA